MNFLPPAGFPRFGSYPNGLGGGGGLESTGGSMFTPLTAGLFALNTGIQAFSGFNQGRTASRIADRQIEAANLNAMMNREAMKDAARIQQQENERNRQAMFGWGADLDFARQKEAGMLETGLFGERRLNLANREKIFNQALANSPDAKEKARFDNELAIQRTIAERTAAMEGMFGPIRRA